MTHEELREQAIEGLASLYRSIDAYQAAEAAAGAAVEALPEVKAASEALIAAQEAMAFSDECEQQVLHDSSFTVAELYEIARAGLERAGSDQTDALSWDSWLAAMPAEFQQRHEHEQAALEAQALAENPDLAAAEAVE